MNKRSKRKVLVIAVLFGVALATVLGLTAFQDNLLYFYSPTQVKAGEAPTTHSFRVGGLVVDGSVKRAPDSLKIEFDVTDNAESMTIEYTGILPDLFREGQGIVAMGSHEPSGATGHCQPIPFLASAQLAGVCERSLLKVLDSAVMHFLLGQDHGNGWGT